jgi:acetyltransferase-like isoleucine patch superfamily enzyme
MPVKMKYRVIDAMATGCALPARAVGCLLAPLRRFCNLVRARVSRIRVSSSVRFDGRIDVVGTADIAIGDHSRIGDLVQLGTEEGGRIRIGEHVRLNRGCTVFAYGELTIGDHTLVGEYATIRDANHGIRKGEHIRSQPHEVRQVRIGMDVWIGRGACILPGVTVGDGCIVGANSVVTKSLPPNTIAVGAPARVLRGR